MPQAVRCCNHIFVHIYAVQFPRMSRAAFCDEDVTDAAGGTVLH